ncbi:MAG: carboxylating nicotinate-nucleotide diphosphorylase [Bacteroidetes bacterium]|nr:carboxylating nicotinate-nucleotide diphosphorylase [Bacteroidota bacterium]
MLPSDPSFDRLLQTALDEDLSRGGDITTRAVIPPEATATLSITSRSAGVLAGLAVGLRAFELIDPAVRWKAAVLDGQPLGENDQIALVTGRAQSLLMAERTCLNVIGHCSGIATATNELVQRVSHTAAMIVDTRKTLPGMRSLQKMAVRLGGGRNHRFGLDDAVMIKDNHIAIAGSIGGAVARARAAVGLTVKIEVEVDTLAQFEEALDTSADIILLDGFTLEDMNQAVAQNAALGSARKCIEASGGVTRETVVAIAETGVDVISVGALTHSVRQLDIGLDVTIEA